MNDPNFSRKVILLAEFGEEGVVGFVINHLSQLFMDDILEDLGAELPVFYGGPVATDMINYIHRCPDKIAGGKEIGPGIYWGGDFEAARALIRTGVIAPDELKFFIGYSGWSVPQLQQEMEKNTWIVSDQYDSDMVFSSNEEQLWKEVIIHLGPKFAHVSNFPKDPSLN